MPVKFSILERHMRIAIIMPLKFKYILKQWVLNFSQKPLLISSLWQWPMFSSSWISRCCHAQHVVASVDVFLFFLRFHRKTTCNLQYIFHKGSETREKPTSFNTTNLISCGILNHEIIKSCLDSMTVPNTGDVSVLSKTLSWLICNPRK